MLSNLEIPVSEIEKDIQYAFFGRQGGVSEGIFSSLNCGLGANDSAQAVEGNRLIVAKQFNLPHDRLLTPYQSHSNKCIYINDLKSLPHKRPEGDALVTDVVDLLIGVVTADCAPVIFRGRKANQQAVIGVGPCRVERRSFWCFGEQFTHNDGSGRYSLFYQSACGTMYRAKIL
jgi:copper oxidase (laccase) domain-containing protein